MKQKNLKNWDKGMQKPAKGDRKRSLEGRRSCVLPKVQMTFNGEWVSEK